MRKFLLFMLGALIALPGIAQEFEYEYKGQTLKYSIVNEYSGSAKVIGPKDKNIKGDLCIPQIAKFEGRYIAIESIGSDAFYGCTGLTSLDLGELSWAEIESGAFTRCTGLTSVNIGDIMRIGDWAFNQCTGLSWLIIPETCSEIGFYAFGDCTGLISIMSLSTEAYYDPQAFEGSRPFKAAAYDASLFEEGAAFGEIQGKWTIEADETVDTEKGIIWSADNSQCWVSGKYTGVLKLREGMTQLPWTAFAFCHGITEIYLPNTLEIIGPQAFYSTDVKDIVVPNRVTKIYDQAFDNTKVVKAAIPDVLENPFDSWSGVTVIKYDAFNGKAKDNFVYSRQEDKLYYAPVTIPSKFVVPETVTEITDKAFALCDNLTEIVLPQGLNKLGNNVWDKCTNLKSVVCTNPNPTEAARELFPINVYDDATLYVPEGSKAKYMSTVPWSYFYNIREDYTGGVDDILSDEEGSIDFSAPVDVYNLHGAKVGTSLDNLATGIYIVRQGNVVKKFAVN